MKIEIRETKEPGIVQITTTDERWYRNDATGLYMPSVTWIAGYYPKGVPFYKWLADKGWNEAEAIKTAAGDKGSRVHKAIEELLTGNEVFLNGSYANGDGEMKEITVEEWECVMSFAAWFNETKPKVLETEQIVWSEENNYAGTLDMLLEIGGERWIVDLKTSQNLWPEHELQVSAYRHTFSEPLPKTAILQVGYRRNKKMFKFTEVEDKFELFQAAKLIWAEENKNVQPKQREYPTSIKLGGFNGTQPPIK